MLRHAVAPLAFLAIATPTLAEVILPICAGRGEIVFSDTTGYFPSHVYTVPGSGSVDSVRVNVQDCGRRLSVSFWGQGLILVPDAIGNGWSGELPVEDVTMFFNLSRIGPKFLMGSTEILREGGALRTDVFLRITDGVAPAMDNCLDTPPEPLPARGTTLGHAALADALSDRSLPGDLAIWDFVSPGQVTSGGGTERVHIMLSAAGEILPLNPPALTLDELCAGATGFREPPREMLNFKIMRFENTTTVFVQRIAVETGKITEQHETVARGEDQSAITAAMEDAIAALRTPPGSFSTGLP
jgi:hypothetical protein